MFIQRIVKFIALKWACLKHEIVKCQNELIPAWFGTFKSVIKQRTFYIQQGNSRWFIWYSHVSNLMICKCKFGIWNWPQNQWLQMPDWRSVLDLIKDTIIQPLMKQWCNRWVKPRMKKQSKSKCKEGKNHWYWQGKCRKKSKDNENLHYRDVLKWPEPLKVKVWSLNMWLQSYRVPKDCKGWRWSNNEI